MSVCRFCRITVHACPWALRRIYLLVYTLHNAVKWKKYVSVTKWNQRYVEDSAYVSLTVLMQRDVKFWPLDNSCKMTKLSYYWKIALILTESWSFSEMESCRFLPFICRCQSSVYLRGVWTAYITWPLVCSLDKFTWRYIANDGHKSKNLQMTVKVKRHKSYLIVYHLI